MRRALTIIFAVIGMIFVLNAAAAAQLATRYKGIVPFAFTAKGHDFPAGEYLIGPVSSISNMGGVILVNRDNGKGRIIGLGNFGNDQAKSAVIEFAYVDGRYHMSAINTPTLVLRMRRTSTGVREVAGGEPTYIAIVLTEY